MHARSMTIVAILLVMIIAVASAETDYDAGMTAYRQRDWTGALDVWRPLAEHGDARAQYYLGLQLAFGRGARADPLAGLQWIRRAAGGGDATAQTYLSDLYAFHGLAPQDPAEAIAFYATAAESGDPIAQLELGTRLLSGKGAPQDPEAGLEWLRRAAEAGVPGAQRHLGRLFKEGDGVGADPAEAARWYGEAARRGDSEAQFELGRMYLEGNPAAPDPTDACLWFSLSASTEWPGAERASRRCRRKLSREQRAVVKARVESWQSIDELRPLEIAADVYLSSIGGVSNPVLKHKVAPDSSAFRSGAVSGSVILVAVIRQDGTVGDLKIFRQDDPLLARAAIAAVAQWRYKPAELDGRPVAAQFLIFVDFKIR